ncbi:MAG: DUF523 domain-containing protein [Ruminococcaceae bacterium]|nr:DUF523 domain-containing protein [Oscillospiraceae bacterium]
MKKLLISACLYGEKCRYDGKDNMLSCLDLLKDKFTLIPVCPEVSGGLETPRNPSEIIGDRVVMNNGRDVTAEYTKGAEIALGTAIENGCDVALMKAKSPSCGSGKIYDGTFSRTLTDGDGITVGLLKKNGIKVFNETQIKELVEYMELQR